MKNQETVIDIKFGLSQLSGNQDLLIKLLSKFHAQYADLADRLDTIIAEDEKIAATDVVHTLKGVTGNLGLTALHIEAKYFETALTDGPDITSAFMQFKSVLQKTLTEIEILSQKTNSTVVLKKDNLDELKESLLRQEYISAEKLDGYLSGSEITELNINLISQAVDELDYPKALAILESN